MKRNTTQMTRMITVLVARCELFVLLCTITSMGNTELIERMIIMMTTNDDVYSHSRPLCVVFLRYLPTMFFSCLREPSMSNCLTNDMSLLFHAELFLKHTFAKLFFYASGCAAVDLFSATPRRILWDNAAFFTTPACVSQPPT